MLERKVIDNGPQKLEWINPINSFELDILSFDISSLVCLL